MFSAGGVRDGDPDTAIHHTDIGLQQMHLHDLDAEQPVNRDNDNADNGKQRGCPVVLFSVVCVCVFVCLFVCLFVNTITSSCRAAMYVKCSEDSDRMNRKSPFSTGPD